jgi:NADPH:quinone reductase-like Zn-dependent oxidoreductase
MIIVLKMHCLNIKISKKMKAIKLKEYGSGENLRLEETEKPEITDDQVLVKIYAASVNQFEIKVASGVMKEMFPIELPWIPGSDFSGVVKKIGKNVTSFKEGDEVYGNAAGTYTEYVAADEDKIAVKPAPLDFEQAASVPVVAMTAYQGLFKHGKLESGQTVLIHGAAGAVGAYAVQFAKNAGAKVIATSSVEDKNFVKSLGADQVIDYKNEKFEELVKDADLVLDVIGGETQKKSYAVLKKGGTLIATSQPPAKEDAEKYGVNAKMMNMQATTENLNEIAVLFGNGSLRVDIAKVYPLEKAGEAWDAIGQNIRKDGSKPTEKIGHGKAILKII